jgi:predicted phage terminase large subunit-like protein
VIAALEEPVEVATEPTIVGPQPGPQEAILASTADIVIGGGAAGAGKTWSLLIEPIRHVGNARFGAVIFRRTYPQITNEGGLWDEAQEVYPPLGAYPRENELEYIFPSGMTVKFSHMQHAKDRFSWSGSQIPMLGFDQLEEFEEPQFWFMLSRNRSARAGVRPYIRATCNPVPDDDPIGGWLHRLIQWWIDPRTGYAIPERSGVIRWFVRLREQLFWGDSRAELVKQYPGSMPKSLTFIPATLADNPALDLADPGYRASLMALPLVERERLLGGNWNVKATAGKVFNRAWFKSFLRAIPSDVVSWVRYWDKAGTEGGGKFSAGVLMGKRANGRFVIADIVRGQWSAGNRETVILQTARSDRPRGNVAIWVEQEPGSGGKESAENTVRSLAGFTVHAERVTGTKLARAGPLSAQVEAGNVDLLDPLGADPQGVTALEAFLREAQNFDGEHGVMDQIDGASGAFNKLTGEIDAATESAETVAHTRANYGRPLRARYGRAS